MNYIEGLESSVAKFVSKEKQKNVQFIALDDRRTRPQVVNRLAYFSFIKCMSVSQYVKNVDTTVILCTSIGENEYFFYII